MSEPFSAVTAAILAGGLGTRLRSVVTDRPKVLAPVGGRPFVTHLLDRLAAAGVRETVLLVGFGAGHVRSALGNDYAGMRLTHSAETGPLGTGGALRLALPAIPCETVLLLNGDSYCDVDLKSFYTSTNVRPGAVGMVLADVPDAARYGRVEVTPSGDVVQFLEKTGDPAPGRINAGIYLIPRACVAAIPPGRAVSLERDLMPGWVGTVGVRAFGGGRFIDIGTPESYADAEHFFRGDGPHVG